MLTADTLVPPTKQTNAAANQMVFWEPETGTPRFSWQPTTELVAQLPSYSIVFAPPSINTVVRDNQVSGEDHPNVFINESSRETDSFVAGYLRCARHFTFDLDPFREVAYAYGRDQLELYPPVYGRTVGTHQICSRRIGQSSLAETWQHLAIHIYELVRSSFEYRGQHGVTPQIESGPEVRSGGASEVARLETHVDAIHWLEAVAGLTKESIRRLVGVERPTIYAWLEGAPIRNANRQRVLAVREVLERVAQRFPEPNQIATWLDTPRGAEARTPRSLLEANEIGKARLLALSTASPRDIPVPEWTLRARPNARTVDHQRRRERVGLEDSDSVAALLEDDED
jgi:hypothetical protein